MSITFLKTLCPNQISHKVWENLLIYMHTGELCP